MRGLAGFDALFLLMAIFNFGLPTLSPWFEQNIFMRYMALGFGLIHTFRVGSVYTTLAVTFERFQVIVFPLKHIRYSVQCFKFRKKMQFRKDSLFASRAKINALDFFGGMKWPKMSRRSEKKNFR